jgi:predicted nucleic acid-binding protein
MAFLIDTDVLSDHLADEPAAVQLLQQLALSGIAIAMVTYMESFQGALQSPDPTSGGEAQHVPRKGAGSSIHVRGGAPLRTVAP